MLDVHPPHQAAHTWKDFFIHIATIVVGLLIALALEQTVELFHHRHLLHQAEHNLAIEAEQNRATLASDESQMQHQAEHLRRVLAAIPLLRAHKPIPQLNSGYDWDDLASSAWETARSSGVTSLMSYQRAQYLADHYNQQQLINEQSAVYLNDIYSVTAPLQNRQLTDLDAAQLDHLEAQVEQALADAAHLLDLCHSLDQMNTHPAPRE